MKIIILPGFSSHNRQWAEEAKSKLSDIGEIIVCDWRHWQTGNSADFDVELELKTILEAIGTDEVYVVAKSVGCYMAMLVLEKIYGQILKVVLCGITLSSGDMSETERTEFQALNLIGASRVLCFQNTDDPYGNFQEAKKFMETVNNEIQVVAKKRNDHEYPYFGEFKKFLAS